MIYWDDERFQTMMKLDGYDDCLVGICTRFGQEPILAYSLPKVIERLKSDGMTEEEAWEWFEFNTIGAWVGETTPCFISELDGEW